MIPCVEGTGITSSTHRILNTANIMDELDKECNFDELWQLLLHHDIDDPSGNSFIKKDALRLPSGISSQ